MLLTNARFATMQSGGAPYGALDDAALLIEAGRIAWLGPLSAAPRAAETADLGGRWVLPGLVDCHTHIVFGGNRAREFELRLEGATYEEVARAGGGILSTVKATRAASVDELVAQALPRLDHLLAEGVTTIEIKSGYGLELESEIRMLEAARRLADERDVEVQTSLLAAHAVPPEFKGRADAYVDIVVSQIIPAVRKAGLADAVDGFCEGIAFSPAQMRRVFEKARAVDLPVKLHAEQLSDLKGAVLAAGFGALSADHLEYVQEDGVRAMAAAGTVAVLLPGAFYTLREKQAPPVDLLRRHGVPIAIATDCNPGSSPVTSLLLVLNMAATLFRLTPEEALAGVTRNAARALGLEAEIGTLEVGKRADLAIFDIDHPAELAYRIGYNPLFASLREGRWRPC
ncbi:MAG: imidazolonepropionase [Geminicoccaceae bacterium]|jgi:imidazolonepropionase|nr:imidazolonepropionase [Geminicoccaceae bacterium]HRY23901.1 imidazolonepropionase [Geminicoccaceae bacterium]